MRLTVVVLIVATNIAAAEARAEDWSSLRPKTLAVCRNSCQQQRGVTSAVCAQYCDCTISGMEAIFTYQALSTPNHVVTADEQRRLNEMTIACSQRTLGR
jgi:hypothetical protein